MLQAGSVLVVCTGNVCRSPYIEMRLRHELAGTGITVSSSGTRALVNQEMDPGSSRLLGARGVPAQEFKARQLIPEMVAGADLVLAAAREHRSAAVRLYPAGLRKVITLHDLADLLARVSPAEVRSRNAPGTWVAQVVSAAQSRRAIVPARQDTVDLTDPFGLPEAFFGRMASEVDSALQIIVPVLRGVPPGSESLG